MLIQCSTQDESSSKLNQAVAGADADAAVPKEQPDSSESNSPHQPTPAQETPLGSEKQDVPEEPKVQLSKEMEGTVDSSMFYYCYFQIIRERDLIKREWNNFIYVINFLKAKMFSQSA